MHPEPEDDGDAARAFEALRAEMAALRRGVELVYRRGQQVGTAAPDYSLTLRTMAQTLQAIMGRLEAVEQAPTHQAAELRRELHQIGQDARGELTTSQAQLDATVQELRGVIGSARTGRDQKRWLWTASVVGLMLGVGLWYAAARLLPRSAGDWIAASLIGGDKWHAGETLMEEASPDSWDKMARLYKACPPNTPTESCEAAIAVRTAEQGAPGQAEDRNAHVQAPSRPLPRGGRPGQQGQ